MHTKYLLNGNTAPDGWDVIRVERIADDQFDVTGEIAVSGGAKLERLSYPTLEDAIGVGKTWAFEQGCQIVYLEIA